MKSKDVCVKLNITKKALSYYEHSLLVHPKILANGYREYSDDDVSRLQEIIILRKLDVSIKEIQAFVSNGESISLDCLYLQSKRRLKLEIQNKKQQILRDYLMTHNQEEALRQLGILEKKMNIRERLLLHFPGYFGRMLSLHFGRFLNEEIQSAKQEEAFVAIMNFLDSVELKEPKDEIKMFILSMESYQDQDMEEALWETYNEVFNDFDGYYELHKEEIEAMQTYKQSDAYKDSLAMQYSEYLKDLLYASRYYEVFIPTMRELSSAYDDYYQKLMDANDKLLVKILNRF